MLQVPCPQCRRLLAVAEKFAGRVGRCPSCEADVPIESSGIIEAFEAAETAHLKPPVLFVDRGGGLPAGASARADPSRTPTAIVVNGSWRGFSHIEVTINPEEKGGGYTWRETDGLGAGESLLLGPAKFLNRSGRCFRPLPGKKAFPEIVGVRCRYRVEGETQLREHRIFTSFLR